MRTRALISNRTSTQNDHDSITSAAAATRVLRGGWMIGAIVPTPEPGEPRVAAGDLGFLLVVALWVAGLAWLGFMFTRRFWVSRRDSRTDVAQS